MFCVQRILSEELFFLNKKIKKQAVLWIHIVEGWSKARSMALEEEDAEVCHGTSSHENTFHIFYQSFSKTVTCVNEVHHWDTAC